MRTRFLYIIILFLLIVTPLFAQVKNTEMQLRFEPQYIDFGTFKEENGVTSRTITVTNISKKPYVVNYISTSCGCAVAEFSKAPLMPGKSRELKVTYDPARRPGFFDKKVFLVSNNNRREDAITIRGEVKAKPKTLSEMYPIETLGGVIISNDLFPFGLIPINEHHTMKIEYYNNSKKEVKINFEVKNKKAIESLEFHPKTLKAGAGGEVRLSYNLTGEGLVYGDIKSEVTMSIDGVKWNKPLISNALLMPNFFEMTNSERAIAPRVVMGILEKTLTVEDGHNVVEYSFPVKNGGDSPLKFLFLKSNNSRVTFQTNKKELQAGEKGYIKAIIDTKGLQKGINKYNITVLFNAPDSPFEVLNIEINRI